MFGFLKHSKRRWSDNDRHFGPFTYAYDDGYQPLGIELDSGEPDYAGCSIRFRAFGHTLILDLPPWVLRPRKKWVDTSRHDWSKDPHGFFDLIPREYGFSFVNGSLHISYGEQTHDSLTDKTKVFFLPWQNWRFVRYSLYDLEGNLFWSEDKQSSKFEKTSFDEQQRAEDACPSACFMFLDYDLEKITATTLITEREWRFGTGWFKWLSFFRRPRVRRSLKIEYDNEVGKKKGSWKGGILGTGIDMEPGELHKDAFTRHCEKNDLTPLYVIT